MAKFSITQDPNTLDPKAIGLKSGIEIHQQLATTKLFCNCPSHIREDKHDFEITRQLRASAGESGVVDQAALAETRKQKSFRYHGYLNTNCLIELDEEPPQPINADALNVATQVAKMLGSDIFPKAQVMRKTVVDGSNTSGFQRTMLLALGGEISGKFGTCSIEAVCLEEDSAKVIERNPDYDVYNLSRLGIPLIEIATGPDLNTPEMIRDAAAHIGLILRSTRQVKRGLGTIRQDVNISVAGGSRVEIKGAQDLKMIPTLVRNEMARQVALIALRKELEKLSSKNKGLTVTKPTEVTKLFSQASGFIGKLIKNGASVVGIGLESMRGLFGAEMYPGYRVGTELAGYVKANGFGGIVHCDEDPKKYGVDFSLLEKTFGTDAWFVLVGEKDKITSVIEQVILPRIEQFFNGIPMEVRKANADGTTTYLRPMPGASRMYPETDIPFVAVNTDVHVPKLLTEQISDFAKKHSISIEIAKEAIELPPFEELVSLFPKIPAAFIAEALIIHPKEILKREKKELSEDTLLVALKKILTEYSLAKIPKSAVYELLVSTAHGKKLDFTSFEAVDVKEVEKVVDAVIAADPNAPIGALMGQAMAKLRGKADGKIVMGLLQKKMK